MSQLQLWGIAGEQTTSTTNLSAWMTCQKIVSSSTGVVTQVCLKTSSQWCIRWKEIRSSAGVGRSQQSQGVAMLVVLSSRRKDSNRWRLTGIPRLSKCTSATNKPAPAWRLRRTSSCYRPKLASAKSICWLKTVQSGYDQSLARSWKCASIRNFIDPPWIRFPARTHLRFLHKSIWAAHKSSRKKSCRTRWSSRLRTKIQASKRRHTWLLSRSRCCSRGRPNNPWRVLRARVPGTSKILMS